MKMTKRLFALALSVLMLLGVFTFCAFAKAPDRTCETCGNKMRVIADYSCAKVQGNEKNYAVYYCETCDTGKPVRVYFETALDHDWAVTDGKDASCTEAGREAGKECKICGYSEAGAEIPALGHTANDDGYCSRCGEDLSSDRCPYCKHVHGTDFGGKFTRFFHNIAYFFQNMFNR